MAVTLMQLLDGVADTLETATGVKTCQSYDELTEGTDAIDCPRIRVHPDRGTNNPNGWTERTTFQAGVQQVIVTIFADLYSRPRSQLNEDMKVTVELIDAIMTKLQEQRRPPFFGVAGIKAFNWDWARATFRLSEQRYMGARFVVNLRIF